MIQYLWLIMIMVVFTGVGGAEEITIPKDYTPLGGYLGVNSVYRDRGNVITAVVFDSPAEKQGLLEDDFVTKIDDIPLTSDQHFAYLLGGSHPPGDTVTLTVIRRCENLDLSKEIELAITLGSRQDTFGEMKKGIPQHQIKKDPYPLISENQDENEILILEIMEQKKESLAGYELLQTAFRNESDEYGGYYKFDIVDYVLRNPAKFSAINQKFLNDFANKELTHLIPQVYAYTRQQQAILNFPFVPLNHHATLSEHIDQIEARMGLANAYLETAFAQLDSLERGFMLKTIPKLLDHHIYRGYLHMAEREDAQNYIKIIHLTKEIDYSSLFEAIAIISLFYDTEYLNSLKNAISQATPQDVELPPHTHYFGDLIDFKSTPWGNIVIGGEGDNQYLSNAAVIIDLGGDDIYQNNCGGSGYTITQWDSLIMDTPTAILIDLAGDDIYEGNKIGTIGTGLMGVGMLVDMSGDDQYRSGVLSQGSSFIGGGFLIDESGNDVYSTQECALGCSYFGMGLVLDQTGNDYYSSTLFSQGFGGTEGIGMLFDIAGNDRYYAQGKHGSGYGTASIWSGWSQGVGMGFRTVSCGGIGFLQDLSGNDVYYAGNFSQGIGYFFAFGLLNDTSGNDQYYGMRYAQGCGIHQAIGAFVDQQGNDRYEGRITMNQGAAWDVGAALFLEYGGDDVYSGAWGQGSGQQNGFVLFRDYGGNDNYHASTSNGQGWSGKNTYHGGRNAPNIVFTIDSGGNDRYNLEGRENQTLKITGEWGVFYDE